MTKAPLENTVSWSLIDPLYSVVPLFAPPIPNLTGVMQSKCAPSQAFPACCSLQSLPELHLLFLSRSSSGYILCSCQVVFLGFRWVWPQLSGLCLPLCSPTQIQQKTRVYFKREKVEEARKGRADLVNNEAKGWLHWLATYNVEDESEWWEFSWIT